MRLNAFKGAITSVDPSLVGNGFATETRNARAENGALKVRYGLNGIANVVTGTSKGLHLARGYNDSNVFKEEYIAFRSSGGSVKPYSVDPDSGVGTEITNGATPLALTNAEWYSENFGGYSYHLTPGGSVYKHEIETNTSWTLADPGQPNQFTTGNFPFIEFEQTDPNDPVSGTSFSWAGFVGAGLTNNNASPATVAFDSVSGTSLVINPEDWDWSNFPAWSASGVPDYVLDFDDATAGIQDWSTVTKIQFVMARTDGKPWHLATDGTSALFPWGPGTVVGTATTNMRVWITDNAANTYALTGSIATIIDEDGLYSYRVFLTIPAGPLAQLSDARYLRLYHLPPTNEDGTFASNYTISQITTDAEGSAPTTPEQVKLRFGAVAYDGELAIEAFNPTFSAEYNISIEHASRYYGISAANPFLGNVATVNIPETQMATFAALPQITEIRWYVAFMDEGTTNNYTMRLMGTTDPDESAYEVPYTYEELRELPLRDNPEYQALGTPVCMCAFRQWMVWGYAGGSANIKHSRIGKPYSLASTSDDAGGTDLAEDLNRPATFTLADNFADEPKMMVGSGDSLYIFGSDACYVQTSLTRLAKPSNMSPVRRVPGALGILGRRSSCAWRDERGVEGVAYVSADGESVWFVVAASDYNDVQYSRVELTAAVRGQLKSFLFGGSAPTVDLVHVFADERDDALWVTYQNKAMVLRRRNFVDKNRPWEFHQYNLNSPRFLSHWSSHIEHGLRVLRDDCRLLEAERRKSTNFTPIEGTNRDDGNAPASMYWQSGKFVGDNRRAMRVRLQRLDETETVVVTDYCDRTPAGASCTVGVGEKHARFDQFAQGWNHQFRIALTEGQDGIYSAEIEETPLGQRKNL